MHACASCALCTLFLLAFDVCAGCSSSSSGALAPAALLLRTAVAVGLENLESCKHGGALISSAVRGWLVAVAGVVRVRVVVGLAPSERAVCCMVWLVVCLLFVSVAVLLLVVS